MGAPWEAVVVGLLVAVSGAWALRALVRSLKKPGGCSSCAGSGNCPAVKGPNADVCANELNAERPARRGSVALH